MQCRARLASVCRRWRKISTSIHAAVVWQRLSIDEAKLGRHVTDSKFDSLVHWCRAHGGHVHELQLLIAKEADASEVQMHCSTSLHGW
jgi:hypothetical protein